MMRLRYALVIALAAAAARALAVPERGDPAPVAGPASAPADTYRRRLAAGCEDNIAGYVPETNVDQHAYIDLDMEELLTYIEDDGSRLHQRDRYLCVATPLPPRLSPSLTPSLPCARAHRERRQLGQGHGLPHAPELRAEGPRLRGDSGRYNAYYGSTSYFDDEISAALAGTANTLSTNGGDYSSAVDATRAQVAKKVTAYGAVWIYAIHEFEAAIVTAPRGDTYSAQHAWDEGWAFYAGSTQVTASTSGGNLVYYLAQKRCENYGTCATARGLRRP